MRRWRGRLRLDRSTLAGLTALALALIAVVVDPGVTLGQADRAATAIKRSLAAGTSSPAPTIRASEPPTRSASPRPAASSAAPAAWTVTGLGDSVTAGYACNCRPFVQLYAGLTRRATGIPVHAENLGVSGQTSGQLLSMIAGSSAAAGTVAGSDIVLLTTGANDLNTRLRGWQVGECTVACFAKAMPAIQANISAIVNRIHALRSGRPTQILVTDYWNVFTDGQPAAPLGASFASMSDQVTRLANAAICAGARAAGVACVDLYAPFKGDGTKDPTPLLASDGDHPDAAGHEEIAELLADRGWRVLTGAKA